MAIAWERRDKLASSSGTGKAGTGFLVLVSVGRSLHGPPFMGALYHTIGLSAFFVPFLAITTPSARRLAGGFLALLGALLLVITFTGRFETIELIITHNFVAYDGQRPAPKDFVVDTAQAPAWQWAAIALVWCFLWALWAAHRSRSQGTAHPFGAPLVLAWGGSALVLALEKSAAPATIALGIGPISRLEFAVIPATVAAALLLAQRSKDFAPLILNLSIFIALARLPLAIFGTFATTHRWGTSLDVHSIDFIANVFTQTPLELLPGSSQQLTWVLWVPQLLVWPAFTFMSAGGIGFAALMFRRAPA
ncbi:MAG: hypothetical protein QF412_02695 [Planctomycetota bacterium]|nr:hypothetical protein [Planctomycetota bacterium]